jgi:hypothetical protein
VASRSRPAPCPARQRPGGARCRPDHQRRAAGGLPTERRIGGTDAAAPRRGGRRARGPAGTAGRRWCPAPSSRLPPPASTAVRRCRARCHRRSIRARPWRLA